MGPSKGIHVIKATKQKLCIGLRTMQRRKLCSMWTAGTLLWRGHVDLGNSCSLPCTTSKTVLWCLSHTACFQRTAKNGIGKYHAIYTKLYTLLFLYDNTLLAISRAKILRVWFLKTCIESKSNMEISKRKNSVHFTCWMGCRGQQHYTKKLKKKKLTWYYRIYDMGWRL